jgi:hypothetical protein
MLDRLPEGVAFAIKAITLVGAIGTGAYAFLTTRDRSIENEEKITANTEIIASNTRAIRSIGDSLIVLGSRQEYMVCLLRLQATNESLTPLQLDERCPGRR